MSIIIFLVAVFLATVSQVMLKKAAQKQRDSILKDYLNPLVICAYIIFLCTTFMSVWAYRELPLSVGVILETTGYVYITIFGVMIFKEGINLRRVIALLLIVVGIVVYGFA